MKVAAVVWRDDPWYVARCLDVDVASQGETADEATENLKEALRLLAAAPAAVPGEPPTLVLLDVPGGAAPERASRVVERARLLQRLEARGWVVESANRHFLLRRGERVVAVPAFVRIAPGVYETVAKAVGEDVLAEPAATPAESLARLDALFAAHPHRDDAARLIREQRDAG